jgi:hypothetical protein
MVCMFRVKTLLTVLKYFNTASVVEDYRRILRLLRLKEPGRKVDVVSVWNMLLRVKERRVEELRREVTSVTQDGILRITGKQKLLARLGKAGQG